MSNPTPAAEAAAEVMKHHACATGDCTHIHRVDCAKELVLAGWQACEGERAKSVMCPACGEEYTFDQVIPKPQGPTDDTRQTVSVKEAFEITLKLFKQTQAERDALRAENSLMREALTEMREHLCDSASACSQMWYQDIIMNALAGSGKGEE